MLLLLGALSGCILLVCTAEIHPAAPNMIYREGDCCCHQETCAPKRAATTVTDFEVMWKKVSVGMSRSPFITPACPRGWQKRLVAQLNGFVKRGITRNNIFISKQIQSPLCDTWVKILVGAITCRLKLTIKWHHYIRELRESLKPSPSRRKIISISSYRKSMPN